MENKMIDSFPVEELSRMITNIDRFDTEVVSPRKIKLEKALEEAEKVSDKIIAEDNV